MQNILNNSSIADVMSSNVYTVYRNQTIRGAMELMARQEIRHLIVIDFAGKPLGILSQRDVFRHLTHLLKSDRNPNSVSVTEAMECELVTVSSDAQLTEASELMATHKIGCLPVLDDKGQLIGIASVVDILRALSHNQIQSQWHRYPGAT